MNTVEAHEYRDLLRALLRARAFEALCKELPGIPSYPPGDVRQLSPAVPAAFSLRRRADATGDVFSLRRGTPAAALLFGLPAEGLFRQALGRATAPARGRDPGGFPTDLDRGLLAPVPVPGALVEVMAGVALSFGLRGMDRVALLVDDLQGSASGFWHEGLNFSAVNRAPLVLVSDSGAAPTGASPGRPLAERAAAYGVTAHGAPAGDPMALAQAIAEAVQRAREGQGVQVVEATRQAADEDVVATLAGRLRWADAVADDEIEAWTEDAVREMEDALAQTLEEPRPDATEARASLYPTNPEAPNLEVR